MDKFIDKLNYHTSMENKKGGVLGEPWFPKYYTSLQSTDIAINNLKKINNRLDENNIVTLAFLANNPHISDEDREKYEKQLIHFLKVEQTKIEEIKKRIYNIDDIIRRNEDSSINESERNN